MPNDSVYRSQWWSGFIFAIAVQATLPPPPLYAGDVPHITVDEVLADFGLTDTDLRHWPNELFDCLRLAASCHNRLNIGLGHDADLSWARKQHNQLAGAHAGDVASKAVVVDNTLGFAIRGPSGMYESIRSASRISFVYDTTGDDQDNLVTTVESDIEAVSQEEDEYDRAFLSRDGSGELILNEEWCDKDDTSGQLRYWSLSLALEVLDGSWEEYLAGNALVARLSPSAKSQRQVATSEYSSLTWNDATQTPDDDDIQLLKRVLKIPNEINPEVTWRTYHDFGRDLVIVVKKDAMLFIQDGSGGTFIGMGRDE